MNVLFGRGISVSVAASVLLVIDCAEGAVEMSTSRAMTPAAAMDPEQPPPPARPAGRPGAAGLRDAYFPHAGNGGYDVQNYAIDLRFSPERKRVIAAVRIAATATQDLSTF